MSHRGAGWQVTVRGLWVLALCLALACQAKRDSPPGPAEVAEPRSAVTLVVVGSYPAAAIAEMEPLVRWLNEALAPEGRKAVVRVATTVPEAAAWLAEGTADVYFDSPHPVMLARHLSECRPILRRWKFGTPTYDSLLFVRADSGIRQLEDLRGRTIAFEDRYSSSSFFLPMDFLLSQGYEGVFLGVADDPMPTDRIGFVLSGGDSNTMHWVLAGRVAAGAMNDWNLNQLAGDERSQLHILATTDEVPRHLVAVRTDLDPVVEARLRGLLMSAHESPEGRAMLAAFSQTDRFDDLPPEFVADMDRMQKMVVELEQRVSADLEAAP